MKNQIINAGKIEAPALLMALTSEKQNELLGMSIALEEKITVVANIDGKPVKFEATGWDIAELSGDY